MCDLQLVHGQKRPEKRQKHIEKGHEMVKNQNFEKLLKTCLDIFRPKDKNSKILCSWIKMGDLQLVHGQKIPEKRQKNTFKKGHKMVKNKIFEKLLKICLDIDLKIRFSKHYVPLPKTIYMR